VYCLPKKVQDIQIKADMMMSGACRTYGRNKFHDEL